MSQTFRTRSWLAATLVLAVASGCGGSASRRDSEPEGPLGASGSSGEPSTGAAGSSTSAGSGAAIGGGGAAAGGSGSVGGVPVTGGSPETGAAGEGGEPMLELPPGCHARTSTETDALCSLSVDCDASPALGTYCHRLDSGQWECQCALEDRMYRLENAEGLGACALSATLCADRALKLGEETCERSNETSETDDCQLDITCQTPIELEKGTEARAWLLRAGWARCHRWPEATSFGCEFFDGSEKSSYAVQAKSGADVCGPFTDFCLSGEPPASEGEKYCATELPNAESQSCYETASCGRETSIAAGVSLFTQVERREANCEMSAGGGSECFCVAGATSMVFSFRLPTPPDEGSCLSAALNCTPDPVIEPQGAPRCKGGPVGTADELACTQSFGCDQDVKLDGRSIVAHGRIGLMCRRFALGKPWVCSCATDGEALKLDIGATSADPAEACSQASVTCLEQLTPQIGLQPEYLDVPDPVIYLSGAQ